MTTPPNSEPPNEPPSREAVEAAMLYYSANPYTNESYLLWNRLADLLPNDEEPLNWHAARILAAEVQRLRALVDEPQGKQIKPGPDKPVTEPDLYCGACGQPSAQSLWFSGSHTAMCPVCAAEFVCGAGR